MGLLNALSKSESPKTAIELTSITGDDKLLISNSSISPVMLAFDDSFSLVRILRPLAATYTVVETAYEIYAAVAVFKAFAIPALLGGFKFLSVMCPSILL